MDENKNGPLDGGPVWMLRVEPSVLDEAGYKYDELYKERFLQYFTMARCMLCMKLDMFAAAGCQNHQCLLNFIGPMEIKKKIFRDASMHGRLRLAMEAELARREKN